MEFTKEELENEIWKDIPGKYEGLYQASDLGRIKSLSRKTVYKDGRIWHIEEKILKRSHTSNGYLQVSLSIGNSIVHKKRVHRIIMLTFEGPSNLGVDHKDEIKTNNRYSNLRYLNQRGNVSRSMKNGTSKYTGVCWHKHKNKWYAYFRIKNKSYHLGCYTDEKQASKAYQKALHNWENYNITPKGEKIE